MNPAKTAPVNMELPADILSPIENPDSVDLIAILQKTRPAYSAYGEEVKVYQDTTI